MARNPKNTRMCAGCRTRCDKSQLVRVARSADGIKLAMVSDHVEGRSVYICHSLKCLDLASKRKSFARSFKCEIEPELYTALEEYIKSSDRSDNA